MQIEIKPVLIEREQVDKKMKSNIGIPV